MPSPPYEDAAVLNPTVEIALALILRRECVLVARRAHGPLSNLWEFPGGKIEPGESVEAAARRECLEELGVEMEVRGRLDAVEHVWPEGRVRLHPVVGRIAAEAVPEPLASGALAWVDPSDLASWPIPEPNHGILAQLALLKPQGSEDAPR